MPLVRYTEALHLITLKPIGDDIAAISTHHLAPFFGDDFDRREFVVLALTITMSRMERLIDSATEGATAGCHQENRFENAGDSCRSCDGTRDCADHKDPDQADAGESSRIRQKQGDKDRWKRKKQGRGTTEPER